MIAAEKKKESGFSFIEVLIAILLIGILLIALGSTLIIGFNTVFKMKQVTVAAQVAQEKIEEIRLMPYDQVPLQPTSFTHESFSYLTNGAGIFAVEDGFSPEIKKISVSITWDFHHQQIKKDFATYVTWGGIRKK
jgi:prepilin-type N-terminal cleavage/methylation domain-containing protein